MRLIAVEKQRFQQLAADKEVAGGGQLYKLLMRAFPGWYRPNSIYALYPFTTPQKTLKVFGEIGMPNGIELLDRDPELLPDPLPGAVQQFNDPCAYSQFQRCYFSPCTYSE